MKFKIACTIFTVLLLKLLHSTDSQFAECKIYPFDRVDCGFPGISQEQCEQRDCCFDNRYRGIYCFYKDSVTRIRPCKAVYPLDREECGYPGISRQTCEEELGCCFDNSISGDGIKHCFHKSPSDSSQHTCKSMYPFDRVDCGYPGISFQQCGERNCCFDGSFSGMNFCFYRDVSKVKLCNAVYPADRVPCGDPGISKTDCEQEDCCFDTRISGVPRCFEPA